MDRPTFEQRLEASFQRLRDLNSTKGKEYSGDEDVLADFKEVAAAIGITPEQALLTYMTKHWRAINSYVQRGRVLTASEPIEGRIDDLILYGHLLHGLIVDGWVDPLAVTDPPPPHALMGPAGEES